MYKLLIFDLDDTLVNSFENEFFRLRLVCEKYGISNFDEVRFKTFYGKPDFEGNLKRELGAEYTEDLLNDFYALSQRYPYDIIINPDYFQAFNRAGVIIGIITNSKKSKCLKKLEKTESNKWDFIYTIEDLDAPKPDAKILSKLSAYYSVDKSECAYIGDSPIDAIFAEKNDVDFFPVQTGVYKWEENVVGYRDVNDVLKLIFNFQ